MVDYLIGAWGFFQEDHHSYIGLIGVSLKG